MYERTIAFSTKHLSTTATQTGQDPAELRRQRWSACGQFGLLGLCVPERFGGLGLDCLTTARVVEAEGRICEDAGFVFSMATHLFACTLPIALRSAHPRTDEIVRGLRGGDLTGAVAITEADAGSDAFALKTTAVRDGADYVLAGAKTYVTNGPLADVFLVYAATDRSAGYLGVSAFIVERRSSGVEVGRPFDTTGLSGAPVSTVYLDGCRVPAHGLLGTEGEGALIFGESMLWMRACYFAAYLGMMERQLERTTQHARTRRQGGKRIGHYQAVSHRIADMQLRLEAARLLVYRACWLRDQGQRAAAEVAMAKLAVTEAAVQSSLDAIQLHGGMGVMKDVGIEEMLRDSLPATIFAGTSEIQRNVIAAELGL